MAYAVKDLLRLEVVPALGCTEPVAIALAASAASSLLPEPWQRLELWLDPNVYKNGLAVSIPGTDGLSGLDLAAALGASCGLPERKLEVLAEVDGDCVAAAREAAASGRVEVTLLPDVRGLHVRARAISANHEAEAFIEGLHDNIVALSLDGKEVESPLIVPGCTPGGSSRIDDLENWLKTLSLRELVALLDQLDDEDLDFLQQGVDMNIALAEQGLKFGMGLGVGKTLERLVRQQLIKKDMILAARMLTSSASDARMAGAPLPAMSSGGSGNHGLTAILTIWAVKDYLDVTPRQVLEAVALSHVITAYVKAHTGRLSAVCGCSVAAGAGATAGVTHLLGGDVRHIAGAIKNLMEDLAGIICDGAKAGCSLKLATAAGTAVQAALFSLQGVNVHFTDGIIGQSPEDTMRNVGTLSTEGMIATDRTILNIMLEKKFTDV
ncbi:serine dehydratase subunit alpha family protein [Desulfovibrio oxyclinae]|uniref:L-cysteine desulfidase family protein n=1 Tax=Desulfovibrio oxyclinae TaxID=63560 RepID=UPI000360BBA6|nr:L-serine ammonia-lyase, iron-sulfur-dependent, subunit alpha [Desulfovibrio oxyclinae]